jgi:hypothetical protein
MDHKMQNDRITGLVTVSCKEDNEFWSSTKGGGGLNHISDCHLLTEDFME